MRELLPDQPIFIGFKMDTKLRARIESPDEPFSKYVSAEDSSSLRICTIGGDHYVGKLVADRLTTDRVQDIERHVLSIIRKFGHDAHAPASLRILACSSL